MLFINKQSIGLDISDHTIEAVEIEIEGDKISILSKSRVKIKPGIVERGEIKNERELGIALRRLFAIAKPRKIIPKEISFGIPESQVYIVTTQLSVTKKPEIEKYITYAAEREIPIEKEDLLFSYKILSQNQEKVKILIIGVSKKLVASWNSFFSGMEIKVNRLDIESIAIFRGIFSQNYEEKTVCLVDIGSATTNISVFSKGSLYYSHSIKIAGDYLSRKLAQDLGIEIKEAEEFKKRFGLDDRDAYEVLQKSLDDLGDEIGYILAYLKKEESIEVEEIVLVGGSSNLKNLEPYYKDRFEIPIYIGNSKMIENSFPLEYIEAVGLALRNLSYPSKEQDIFINLENFHQKQKKLEKQKRKGEEEVKKEKKYIPVPKRPKKSLSSKKKFLIIILIAGLVLVVLSLWYRSHNRNKREQELKEKYESAEEITKESIGNLANTEITEESVDNTEDEDLGFGDRVESDATSDHAASREESDATSDHAASREESDATSDHAASREESIVGDHVAGAEKNEGTEEDSEEESDDNTDSSEGEIDEEMVVIQETGIGKLNVREGPGLNYSIVDEVYPQEEYLLLGKSENWYKIELTGDGEEGWINNKYAEVISN